MVELLAVAVDREIVGNDNEGELIRGAEFPADGVLGVLIENE
jgi:hypothetical protein